MKMQNLVDYYGNQARAAAAIEVSRAALSKWKESGIPIEWQIRWELESKGALRADLPQQIRDGWPS